jgi:hypothetical protein
MRGLGIDYKSSLLDYFTDLTEEYLGDLIEEVVTEYYDDKIDIASEYEDLLEYVINRIVKDSLHGEYDPEKFEKIVKKMARMKGIGRLIISYLVSEYISEYNDIDTLDSLEDDSP